MKLFQELRKGLLLGLFYRQVYHCNSFLSLILLMPNTFLITLQNANPYLVTENGESIQILHYENGEKYEPHFDFFHDKTNQKIGGHRIATVLMYLSNVEKGGETIFPNAEVEKFPLQNINHDFLIIHNKIKIFPNPRRYTGKEFSSKG